MVALLASGCADMTVRLWNLESGGLRQALPVNLLPQSLSWIRGNLLGLGMDKGLVLLALNIRRV